MSAKKKSKVAPTQALSANKVDAREFANIVAKVREGKSLTTTEQKRQINYVTHENERK